MSIGANQNVESGGAGGADIGGSVGGGKPGSILFVAANGTVQQDNTGLYWDDATNRLGIGTTSPTTALDVGGTIRGSAFVAVGATAGSVVFIGPAGVLNISPNQLYWDNALSRLAIGHSSPAYTLDVQGTIFTDTFRWNGASSGSIVFVDSNQDVSQNNANFYWDNANNRLGIGTSTPFSTLSVNGAVTFKRSPIGASYSLTHTDYIVAVTGLAAAVTITLQPAAATSAGRTCIIKDEIGSAATNNIIVVRSGGDTVNADTGTVIASNYGSVTLYSDGGSKWLTV